MSAQWTRTGAAITAAAICVFAAGCGTSVEEQKTALERKSLELLLALESGRTGALAAHFAEGAAPEGLDKAGTGPLSFRNAAVRLVEEPAAAEPGVWTVHYRVDVSDYPSTLFNVFVQDRYREDRALLTPFQTFLTMTGTLRWRETDEGWKVVQPPAAAEPLARACALSLAAEKWREGLSDLKGTPLVAEIPALIETTEDAGHSGALATGDILEGLAERFRKAEDRGTTTVLDGRYLTPRGEALSDAVAALAAADRFLSEWWRGEPERETALLSVTIDDGTSYGATPVTPDELERLLAQSPVRLASYEFLSMRGRRAGEYALTVRLSLSDPASVFAVALSSIAVRDPRTECESIQQPVAADCTIVARRTAEGWRIVGRDTEGPLGYLLRAARAVDRGHVGDIAVYDLRSDSGSFAGLDFPPVAQSLAEETFDAIVAAKQEQLFTRMATRFAFLKPEDPWEIQYAKLYYHLGRDLAEYQGLVMAGRGHIPGAPGGREAAQLKEELRDRILQGIRLIHGLGWDDDRTERLFDETRLAGEAGMFDSAAAALRDAIRINHSDFLNRDWRALLCWTGYLAGATHVASRMSESPAEPSRTLAQTWFAHASSELLTASDDYTYAYRFKPEARDKAREWAYLAGTVPPPRDVEPTLAYEWYIVEGTTTPPYTPPLDTPPSTPAGPDDLVAARAFELGRLVAEYRGLTMVQSGAIERYVFDINAALEEKRELIRSATTALEIPLADEELTFESTQPLPNVVFSLYSALEDRHPGKAAYYTVGYYSGMARLAVEMKDSTIESTRTLAREWWSAAVSVMADTIEGALYDPVTYTALVTIRELRNTTEPTDAATTDAMQNYDWWFFTNSDPPATLPGDLNIFEGSSTQTTVPDATLVSEWKCFEAGRLTARYRRVLLLQMGYDFADVSYTDTVLEKPMLREQILVALTDAGLFLTDIELDEFLIPVSSADETTAVMTVAERFARRFGETRPDLVVAFNRGFSAGMVHLAAEVVTASRSGAAELGRSWYQTAAYMLETNLAAAVNVREAAREFVAGLDERDRTPTPDELAPLLDYGWYATEADRLSLDEYREVEDVLRDFVNP